MASHKLSLEVLQVSNPKIFRVTDLSVYTPLMAVTCPQLLITVPGFQYSAVIPEERLINGFTLNLTACDLDLQTSKCDSEHNDLPDGIYAIRYAVSPHEYVYVDYNHFRMTQALNRLDELYCEIDLADCEPSRDKTEKLAKLRTIEGMFKAAKIKAERCHEADKAKVIFDYAVKLLEKQDCKYC